MSKSSVDLSFYNGKRVLVTGHTGFKGSWMCRVLLNAGAELTGYSLEPDADLSLFQLCGFKNELNSVFGDVRNFDTMNALFDEVQPEIVIHMAAQPLVRESYKNPVYTYETNVMGTVNVLECIRLHDCVKSFVNVTTDKVYKNNEWVWGYRESDSLDGYDPYSNSKSCSELVTHSYNNSFFSDGKVAVSTVRAGNVIGGGDFAADRIIPDCIRAAKQNKAVSVRNPYSVRPYQHVLEPIMTYLLIAQKQYESLEYSGSYNVGPNDADCITTGDLVTMFCEKWGEGMSWMNQHDGGPHEAQFLKLDCSKIKSIFQWTPRWNISEALDKVVEWEKAYQQGKDITLVMNKQIQEYLMNH